MVSPVLYLKKFWAEVPRTGQKFLIRAALLFLVWKVSYQAFLKPKRIIDAPLTLITGQASTKFLSAIYPTSTFTYSNYIGGFDIFQAGKKVLYILDPCNALEVFVVFCVFIVTFPTRFLRAFSFMLIGIASIFILNITRCTLIACLNIQHNRYTGIAHHYIFSIVVYGAILGLWVLYVYKNPTNEAIAA